MLGMFYYAELMTYNVVGNIEATSLRLECGLLQVKAFEMNCSSWLVMEQVVRWTFFLLTIIQIIIESV